MKATLIEQNGSTKIFNIEHFGRSVVLKLNYVSTRNIVQARYVDCVEGRITKWKQHGSFIALLEKHLSCTIQGTRQEFIDKIYYS